MEIKRPSGAGEKRDQVLAQAEAAALGGPPAPAKPPVATPTAPGPATPPQPSLIDRAKKALGFKDGGLVESCHNPDNRLSSKSFHKGGSRG
jgi:hypothetical protein